MQKTTLKQKFLLIIFGLFFGLIILEISLRIAGAFVLYLQERHNHLSFNKNEYRILCLGESTTALGGEDSYPSQLEQMLNAQAGVKKFTVINKGIISTTSKYILAHVEQNLNLYKPQMVIVMIGINDKAYLHNFNKSLWWEDLKSFLEDFRVYKLSRLLYEHVTHRIKEIHSPSSDQLSSKLESNHQQKENFLELLISKDVERFHRHISAADQYQSAKQFALVDQEKGFAQQALLEASASCIELARRYRYHGMYQEAQHIIMEAYVLDPSQVDLYPEWGEINLAQGKYADAEKSFQIALRLDPKNSQILLGMARALYHEHKPEAFFVYDGYLQVNAQDYWGYIELARWLREIRHWAQAELYLNRAIEISPSFDQAYKDMGEILDEQGQYAKEEAFYLKEIALYPQSLHPDSSRLYEALGQFYQTQGRRDLAIEYYQKAAKRDAAEYTSATLVNYSLLLDKILSRHIKVVVMQYPLRNIAPLKDYLGQRNGVIYVENKENFKQALRQKAYSYYFKDNFAYDFGHCTRIGNELIARNLTEIILKNE